VGIKLNGDLTYQPAIMEIPRDKQSLRRWWRSWEGAVTYGIAKLNKREDSSVPS